MIRTTCRLIVAQYHQQTEYQIHVGLSFSCIVLVVTSSCVLLPQKKLDIDK